ncbi:MAG: hypothetical protein R3265_11745 [Hyphomonas sp.]|nr:hypothetical protein [Hyphomonas sp.]
MKRVKVLLILIGSLLAIGGFTWQFWLKGQVEFAEISTAYTAKMVCSCLHVAERDLESCKQDFTVDVGAVSFSDDGETTRASVLGGLIRADARFAPGLGCTLVKS